MIEAIRTKLRDRGALLPPCTEQEWILYVNVTFGCLIEELEQLHQRITALEKVDDS